MRNLLILFFCLFFPNGYAIDTLESCTTLEDGLTTICVEVDEHLIECEQSSLGNFLDSCSVDVDYTISTNYEGPSYVKAFVECVVNLNLDTSISNKAQRIEDAQEQHMALFEDSEHEENMNFFYMYSHRSQITQAQFANVSCDVSEAAIW